MTTTSPCGLGLGVDAGLPAEVARELATRAADLGYSSLWCNDEPSAAGLETLAHFAGGAPDADLGVGVLPLDRFPPARIADDLVRLGLDPARLWLGIGSGRLRPALPPVREAVAELRELLPDTRIVIGAMQRAMCRLGGAVADGVLLNWMPPPHAAQAAGWVQEGAASTARPAPATALYVRVAVGSGAAERVHAEEARYRGFAAAHFAAMDAPVGSVGVAGPDRARITEQLAPYLAAVDLTVVRVLSERDLASLVAVADAAAPMR